LKTQWRSKNINDNGTVVQKVPKRELALWVLESWNEISEDMVRKSFKVCGLSNALNGREEESVGEHLRGSLF
jgi:hypothetical protein